MTVTLTPCTVVRCDHVDTDNRARCTARVISEGDQRTVDALRLASERGWHVVDGHRCPSHR